MNEHDESERRTPTQNMDRVVRRVDALYNDWFGVGQNPGLRTVMLETRAKANRNEAEISRAKALWRWTVGLVAAVPTALGILGWLLGLYTPKP